MTLCEPWYMILRACHPEVESLLCSGALGMNCHPEGASATEGSPQTICGDPSPRVTRFRMTLKRTHTTKFIGCLNTSSAHLIRCTEHLIGDEGIVDSFLPKRRHGAVTGNETHLIAKRPILGDSILTLMT